MADRKVSDTAFLRLEAALQAKPLPWPVLRYKSLEPGTCLIMFPDLNEEETDVTIAELLMTK